MTSLLSLIGRPVVSRSSADRLGELSAMVIDGPRHAVIALRVGKGRKALFVEHASIRAVGPDAIVIDDAALLHPASGPLEEASAKGNLEVLGAPVYTSTGVTIGPVVDLDVDLDRGIVDAVDTDGARLPGDRILGFGGFALVVDVDAGVAGATGFRPG